MSVRLRFFIFMLSLMFGHLTAAGPGDHVNNGGSLAKSNVTFAYQNLHKFIDLCLALKSCELEPYEHELLNKIRINLDLERNNPQQLQFFYGKERPDIFLIDNEFKVAVTGNNIGDPIYFNLDLITGDEKNIFLEPIEIPQAIGLLVHEFGHHHGHAVHEELDRLGSKIQRQAEGEIYRIDFGFFRQSESISYINYWPLEYRPELVVNLKEGFHDLGKYVQQGLVCPHSRNQPITSALPRTFLLANIHWGETISNVADENMVQRILMGSLNMLCQDKNLETKWYEVSFRLSLPLVLIQETSGNFYRLDGEPSLEVLKLLAR